MPLIRKVKAQVVEANRAKNDFRVQAEMAKREFSSLKIRCDQEREMQQHQQQQNIAQAQTLSQTLQGRLNTVEEALASEKSLKVAVVAELQQVHHEQMNELKRKDFDSQTQITKKNSELVMVSIENCRNFFCIVFLACTNFDINSPPPQVINMYLCRTILTLLKFDHLIFQMKYASLEISR